MRELLANTGQPQEFIPTPHAQFAHVPVNPAQAPGRYRRDVDGLRAVAVILVILYHLNRRFAPGGFVGVDIFFVISGFVVTGSVLASPVSSPLAAIARFWRRRILRILPPLLLMVLVSSVVIAVLLPPFPALSYNSNFRTGLSAVFGLGNYYLYKGKLNYFTADQSTNPFVHTWSLGVEEQFYLLFALLFIGVIGLSRGRKQLATSMAVVATLGALSYALFLRTAATDASAAYYFITCRFWEIAVGSLLSCAGMRASGRLRIRNGIAATSLQLIAVSTLIVVIWFYRSDSFPFVPISAAVASAALLITTGRNGTGLISRMLATPILVGVGLISYSLYLWHYPVLLFWRENAGLANLVQYLVVIGGIFIFAILSYRFVELPLRHSRLPFATVLLPGLAAVVIAGLGSAWVFQNRPGMLYIGSPQMWSREWVPAEDFPYYGTDRIVASTCTLRNGSAVPAKLPAKCISVDGDSATSLPTVLVVGDSHAFADWGMAAFGARAGAWRFATLTHDGCWPGAERSMKSESCRTYWERIPALLASTLRPKDSVLISLLWQTRTAADIVRATEMISVVARTAREHGAEVIIEAPLPAFDRPAFLCIHEPYRTNYAGCSVERSDIERQRSFVLTELEALAMAYKNVRVWDPLRLLCPAPACNQFEAGKPLFRDQSHLSYYGSTSLGPAFVNFLRKDRTSVRPI